jgi:polysaccharide deacetylase family protein (PEP-CTERM system associated)
MATQHILSVDVEDYYQVEAFTDIVDRSQWSNYPSRVEANTRRLLDMFDEAGAKATFFFLGWVAERHPDLVREAVARGHEPACHSYWHRLIYSLTPDEFREDTRRAKDVIEQACGREVLGYRAPSYSVTRKSLWALDVLAECGFRYDSSIFPVRHDTYGIPDAPRGPFRVQTDGGALVEYPLTTFRLPLGPNLPVAGGGYLRLLPLWYTTLGRHISRNEGLPLILYIHPWEIDPEQPRLAGRARSRLRHYTNLGGAYSRLKTLISQHQHRAFGDGESLARGAETVDLGRSTQ